MTYTPTTPSNHGQHAHCNATKTPLLIEVDTTMKEISALSPPDGGGIPIAYWQKLLAIFLHGMNQYHVACANQLGGEYSVAKERLANNCIRPIDKSTLLVEISTQAQYQPALSDDTEIGFAGRVT
jgi:hypothetical protein